MADTKEASSAVSNETAPGSRRRKKPRSLWQDPTFVAILVAIVAAVPPLTTAIHGWFDSRSKLELDRAKHANDTRQKYLDRVLSDRESQRVLTFLKQVETDEKLKAWATEELSKTEERLKTKDQLYGDAIETVAKLANHAGPLNSELEFVKKFRMLYEVELLRVESAEIEFRMKEIGIELNRLIAEKSPPSDALKQMRYDFARLAKAELRNAPPSQLGFGK